MFVPFLFPNLTLICCVFFFLNDPAPPEIYPLPLHDALPICASPAMPPTASGIPRCLCDDPGRNRGRQYASHSHGPTAGASWRVTCRDGFAGDDDHVHRMPRRPGVPAGADPGGDVSAAAVAECLHAAPGAVRGRGQDDGSRQAGDGGHGFTAPGCRLITLPLPDWRFRREARIRRTISATFSSCRASRA